MDEELRKIEILKLRVGDLLIQRQIISQALMVLIGGIAGICFMPDGILKYAFIVSGIFYIFVLVQNLYRAQMILKSLYKKYGGDLP